MRLPEDCTVRLVDLPCGMGGMVSESEDGHMNIYINARWAVERRGDALEHEVEHIENDDLHNDKSIIEVERREKRPALLGIPGLMRARDLLPAPPPGPVKARSVNLTPRQARALAECLRVFDDVFMNEWG